MNRLISADLKRIITKPGMYVVVALMALIVLFRGASDTVNDQMEYYKYFFNTLGLTLICIPIFLAVYADEVRSGIMISAIGMGIDRKKIVKGKLWDSFLLLIISYLVLFAAALIKDSTSDLAVSGRQHAFLLLFCLFCVIRGIGIIALSSLVLFLTMSSTGGMLVLILAGVCAAGLLKGIQEMVKLPVYDYSYVGLLDKSFADFQGGNIGWTLILALFYFVIVAFVNIMTFKRKEMEL